jgi:hypothetical protein
MPFFKPNKVGIAPTPYVTSGGGLVAPKQNNFVTKEDSLSTLYVFLPGNIDAYTNPRNGLIKSMSETFKAVAANSPGTANLPKGIPQNHFFNDEEKAFNAAKEKFPQHAFVIMQLSVEKKDLVALEATINGVKTPVYNFNLAQHTQSVTAFKAKENYTVNGEPQGVTYIKSGKGENAEFKSEQDFKSPIIQTRR